MGEPRKIQALEYNVVRERLLTKRHDDLTPSSSPSAAPSEGSKALVEFHAVPGQISAGDIIPCDYDKCKKLFVVKRSNQKCCSPGCRKQKWFDAHFQPIVKPE